MIDTSTLMLGDLVLHHRGWICTVVGVTKDTVTIIARHYGEETFKAEDIHPIELTEEIILMLDWQEIPENDPEYKIKIGLGKQFKNKYYEKVLNINQNSLTDMYWTLNGNVHIKYLHELQHVLKQTTKDTIVTEGTDNKLKLIFYKYGY